MPEYYSWPNFSLSFLIQIIFEIWILHIILEFNSTISYHVGNLDILELWTIFKYLFLFLISLVFILIIIIMFVKFNLWRAFSLAVVQRWTGDMHDYDQERCIGIILTFGVIDKGVWREFSLACDAKMNWRLAWSWPVVLPMNIFGP